jgi:hypothetical protein
VIPRFLETTTYSAKGNKKVNVSNQNPYMDLHKLTDRGEGRLPKEVVHVYNLGLPIYM